MLQLMHIRLGPSYHWVCLPKTSHTYFPSRTPPSLFPLPSSLLYSSHSGNSFSLFSLEKALTLPFLSVSGLRATDPAPPPPPLFPSLALTLAGGYANSSLSFLNWLIEARALWRPCLWAALFPLARPSHNLYSCSFCIKEVHPQWGVIQSSGQLQATIP